MEEIRYISDKVVVKRANAAVRITLEKKKATNTPIVIYDRATKKICHYHSTEGKPMTTERIMRGRYSERVGKM